MAFFDCDCDGDCDPFVDWEVGDELSGAYGRYGSVNWTQGERQRSDALTTLEVTGVDLEDPLDEFTGKLGLDLFGMSFPSESLPRKFLFFVLGGGIRVLIPFDQIFFLVVLF